MKKKIDFEQMRDIVYKASERDDVKIHYKKAIWNYTRACFVFQAGYKETLRFMLSPQYGRLTDTDSVVVIYGDRISDITIEGDEIKFKEVYFGRNLNCSIKLVQEKNLPIEDFL